MADWSRWTPEEAAYLEEIRCRDLTRKEIAALLNERFGTSRHNERTVKNRLRHTRTRTGYDPRGRRHSPATEFKKGELGGIAAGKRREVGTDFLHADGYYWRKVREGAFPESCTMTHRAVWEEAHGPIPDGCCVTFLDGDRANLDIGNLALVTRAELARLNQLKLRGTKEVTLAGITTARLITKSHSIKKEARP